jgi:hypothetical protein
VLCLPKFRNVEETELMDDTNEDEAGGGSFTKSTRKAVYSVVYRYSTLAGRYGIYGDKLRNLQKGQWEGGSSLRRLWFF